MRLVSRIIAFLALLGFSGCGYDTEESKTLSDSNLSRKFFRVSKVNSTSSSTRVSQSDYLIQYNNPNSKFDGSLVTTVNPLIKDQQTSFFAADDTCKHLNYAKITSGWRLPSEDELNALLKADYFHLGNGSSIISTEGSLWTKSAPELAIGRCLGEGSSFRHVLTLKMKVFGMFNRFDFASGPYLLDSVRRGQLFPSCDQSLEENRRRIQQESLFEIARTFDHWKRDFLCIHDKVAKAGNYVTWANIPLYASMNENARTKGVGVEITVVDVGGDSRVSIYPTTRTDYLVGQIVSWNWTNVNRWSRTYYKNREGEWRTAFEASSEFIGDPIN